ncbi:helix-turn-helix domain-containing protein [Kitasatospora cheerisanensis]|uniref:helix-turn-helix domain-containing protein n=1 Tax=Kitasatospora cheerisanensis TaxID=81942 RepID=UPI003CC600F9
MLATAAAWLHHPADAANRLGIHRNTLTARLTHLHRLLHLHPHRLADRATLASPCACTPRRRRPPPSRPLWTGC